MRRILAILCFAVVPQSGCAYTYNWDHGWQYNEHWLSDVFLHDDRDALEKQYDDFYDTPTHRLRKHLEERRSAPEPVGAPEQF
jgi:hypothetical protein